MKPKGLSRRCFLKRTIAAVTGMVAVGLTGLDAQVARSNQPSFGSTSSATSSSAMTDIEGTEKLLSEILLDAAKNG